MARRTAHKAGERQTIDAIMAWRNGMVELLDARRTSVRNAMKLSAPAAPTFEGTTSSDLDEYFDAQRQELNWLVAFNLVASVEAWIRVDYRHRVEQKPKGKVSNAYRTLSQKHGFNKRPPFDKEGIPHVCARERQGAT